MWQIWICDNLDNFSVLFRDGPLENLWGGGTGEIEKKIRARDFLMKKKSCTPINRKKYSCKGPKKIHTRNVITKKIPAAQKFPSPPHNFSNGPSLKSTEKLSRLSHIQICHIKVASITFRGSPRELCIVHSLHSAPLRLADVSFSSFRSVVVNAFASFSTFVFSLIFSLYVSWNLHYVY